MTAVGATVTMYDDTNLDLIPANAEAVAGYVNGRWPTYNEVVARWPLAHHLSIAVTSAADADCLDVEPGDATNTVAPAWVERQLARGVERPVVYTSLSNAQALLNTLVKAGISRDLVRLWTAHYTHREHFCGPGCGFGLKTVADATQWTDRALGRSLDQSVCNSDFFGTTVKQPPFHPWESRSKNESVWREWRLGEGAYKRYGSANSKARPHGIPNPVPDLWKDRLITFLIRYRKGQLEKPT